MKKLLGISLLFLLTVALCSCPYSSAYYLDDEPGIDVDESLLGKWTTLVRTGNRKKEAPVYMHLAKRSDKVYDFIFTGNLNMIKPYEKITSDTLTGTGFVSIIDNRQFFNIRVNARIYIAEFIFEDERITLLPLAEHFTNKMIFSSADLRNSVYFHYKTRALPVIDTEFCLRNMKRIE